MKYTGIKIKGQKEYIWFRSIQTIQGPPNFMGWGQGINVNVDCREIIGKIESNQKP